MKKFYIIFCLVLSIVFKVSAQSDPNAKKILDAVGAKFKSFKAISASFTMKSFTSKGKPNGVKAGTFSSKGSKYLIKQGKTEILCDGTKVYNYDGANAITVADLSESSQSLTPQKILSGAYDKEFTYKLISSAGNFHEIEMYPTDKRKNFLKVNVFVDKAKNIISKARITDKSNNVVEIAFANLNTTANIADNLFVFNKAKYPASVEILD